jgi:hypothetical protein
MYTLIFVTNFVFLGTYADLKSCENALYEIYATRTNVPGQRDPALEPVIQSKLKNSNAFACIPVKKVDK